MNLVRVGDKAPDFSLKGILHNKISDYRLSGYQGRWLVLFFYPADFTFICPTEVTGFSKLVKEFAAENAGILGVSVDSLDSHRSWADELGGIDYPLLSDEEKTLSRAYGVLDEKEGVSLRATFIINPGGEVSYVVISHVNVGRSVEETLRVLKALGSDRLCPSEWRPGEPTGDLDLKY
ncbi:MAG: redoxin domain-containing protein [Deltaproteobacteria bacterium]|nr:redoxin domain-containing protein [Deltaproteobacteria bacterium]